MKKHWKVLSSITLAAVLIVGCGTNENGVEPGNGSQGDRETGYEDPREDIGEGEDEMEISPEHLTVQLTAKESNDMMYEFKLVNETDQEIELSFASLQEFDFIIKDQSGENVYQYSDDRMFGEAIVEVTVAPNEAHVMEIDLKEAFQSLESGTYTLKVWSVARETDKLRTEVEISYSSKNDSGVIKKEGYFVGVIDSNSVEIKNQAGEEKAYRVSEEVKDYMETINRNEPVTFSYREENGQYIITEIIVD